MESPVGRWNTTEPSADQLGRYDAIVVIRPQQLRDETVSRLIAWKAGTEEAGLVREEPHRSTRLSSAVCRRPGTRSPACGTPVICAVPQEPGCEYQARSGGRRSDRTACSNNAPADVGILAWRAGGRTLIHLINYGYDKDSDQVRDVENIELRLSPPATYGLALLAG